MYFETVYQILCWKKNFTLSSKIVVSRMREGVYSLLAVVGAGSAGNWFPTKLWNREYWIYRGPGAPAVGWFSSFPLPSPVSKLYSISFSVFLCFAGRLGSGEDTNHKVARKLGLLSIIQYSLLRKHRLLVHFATKERVPLQYELNTGYYWDAQVLKEKLKLIMQSRIRGIAAALRG